MGITKTPSALSRWTLSYNLRSQIADETNKMFGLRHEDKFSHNDLTPARKHRDNMDESSLCTIFEEYKVFYPTAHPDCLYNIATKDLVTEEIQCLLLNARILGQQQMSEWNNVYKVFLIANRHRKLCRLESGVLRYDSQEQRSNF